jgi:ABC-type phosphate transport system permease subunit
VGPHGPRPFLNPAGLWISEKLGFFPLFEPGTQPRNSVFVASVVLAIMILPIVTAISRDVFAQTPRDQVEAALALGATRWEVIRAAVLPYGRSGVISASMLGLGRALGETVAVLIILSQVAPGTDFSPSIFAGGETFASKIANNAAEFDTPVQDRRLHRVGPGPVRRHLRGERLRPHHRRERRGEVVSAPTTTPTAGSEPLSLRRPSGPRTLKNTLAWVYVSIAAVLAVIPLVWVLWTVVTQGWRLLLTSNWWLESQRGLTPRREGGGAYHAIVGTVEIGLICAVIAVPLGVLGAIFLIEYARGTKVARSSASWSTSSAASPRSSRRCSSTRSSSRSSASAGRSSPSAAPWCC